MSGAQFISKDRYLRAQRINWKNPHTQRIQQIVGDDKLYVGFDKKIKKWVIARLCQRYIVEKWGRRDRTSEVRVPIIWKTWEEGVGGQGLAITHPDLPEYIMKCDRWRRAKDLDRDWAYVDKKAEWGQQSRKRERRELAKEVWKTGAFQKMADANTGTVSTPGPGRGSRSFLADVGRA